MVKRDWLWRGRIALMEMLPLKETTFPFPLTLMTGTLTGLAFAGGVGAWSRAVLKMSFSVELLLLFIFPPCKYQGN